MGLLLHSYRRCPFAMRVRMVLEEKGLRYQVFEENFSNFSEDLLRLHPEGKVPLLIHDGIPIHESSVITEYLDEKFPEPALMPRDPAARAQVRLWTHWADQILKPDLDAFKYEWKDLEPEKKSALQIRLQKRVQELAHALQNRPYLMGENLTLADIHVFPFYRQLQKSRPDFEALIVPAPAVNAWLNALISRPTFEKVMKKRVQGLNLEE
ncbi:MAG: glutathione S-transferase family protein [Bdellovibrionales bacterium]|nr:glutathione S-transferase family protein [Bdellovibrionales bacterium]